MATTLGFVITLCASALSVHADGSPEFYRAQAQARLEADLARLSNLPETADTLATLAHTRLFLGSVTVDPDAALIQLQFGQQRAEAALAIDARHPAARLWYVVNTLRILGLKPSIWKIRKLYNLESELLALRDQHPEFLAGAPDRVLAVLYAEAPGLLLGDLGKAEHHFRRAREIAPQFPANTLLYAAFLLDRQRTDEARRLLQAWPGEAALADYPLYEMIWRRDLAVLRQRLGE